MFTFHKLALIVTVSALSSMTALAKDNWKKVGAFEAGGDGKEVTVSGKTPKCKIKCTEGSVVINTIVVREGSKKTSIEVASRVDEGKEVVVDLNDSDKVTGLRIGDAGKGKYEVYVTSDGATSKDAGKSNKDGWMELGVYSTSGDAIEISHSGLASDCRIECTEGSIIINTVVVRNAGKKDPITVNSRINSGEHKDIHIGEKITITGFRISDGGKGKYKVLVK